MRYPDLSKSKLISFDIETKDPELTTKGTGVYRKDGYILGVSLSNGEGFSEYYNLGHPGCRVEVKNKNLNYLREVLGIDCPKLTTNGRYDLDWLVNGYGFHIPGPFYDILTAEPLLDEYARGKYNLDSIAKKYLGKTKENDKLLEFCAQNNLTTTAKKGGREHLWRMPYEAARDYAIADVDLPLQIWRFQKHLLEEQGLWEVFMVETELFPLLLQMRKTGVRLDMTNMLRTGMKLSDEIYDMEKQIQREAGFKINVKSSADMKKLFDKKHWSYPRNEPTERMKKKAAELGKEAIGNPSFNKFALKGMSDNPFAKKVLDYRHLKTIMDMFIVPYQDLVIGDRLHCDFNPLASDKGGTVSGRFSGSKPNLQQVSSKDEAKETDLDWAEGQILRKLFIPEEDCWWFKNDWSQIEYRFMAHYGRGQGSDHIRERYQSDPNTDYHDEMMAITNLPDRKVVKTLNFGAAYEMGPKTMALNYGWDLSYARNIYSLYHSKVPFIKKTSKLVAKKAENVGYIKTILGRRARLQYRDKSYVMFNRLIQGSAADLMKKAMVDSYKAGVFNVLKPHLTVHDELDCSMPKTKEGKEAGMELKTIMENCMELRVPIIADSEFGENWGTLQPFDGN